MRPRVVITGMGACTAAGNDPVRLHELVCIAYPVERFLSPMTLPADLPGPAQDLHCAQISGPRPETVPGVRRPYPDRPTLLSLVAADGALAQAGLPGAVDAARIGALVGTCFGPSQTVERYLRTLLTEGPAQVSPILFSRAVSSALVGETCRRHGLHGPSSVLLGGSVVGYGLDLILRGDADAVLCVGVDEVREIHAWAYRQAGLLSGGLVLGEGAAAIVLERADHASARGAQALGQVVDYAAGFCPSSVHRIAELDEEALALTMAAALRAAKIGPEAVSMVVGLANGDKELGRREQAAARHVLGAPSRWLLPQRTLGETFGASEVLGVIVGAQALRSEASAARCLVNAAHIGGALSTIVLEQAGAQEGTP